MSLFIPTYEQQQANKLERAEILHTIQEIQDTKSLHHISILAKTILSQEIKTHPMSLDDFIAFTDLPMLVRLMDLYKDEPANLIANSQIQELLHRAIDQITGTGEEDDE